MTYSIRKNIALVPWIALVGSFFWWTRGWSLQSYGFVFTQIWLPFLYLLPFIMTGWVFLKNTRYPIIFTFVMAFAGVGALNFGLLLAGQLKSVLEWGAWGGFLCLAIYLKTDFLKVLYTAVRDFLSFKSEKYLTNNILICILLWLVFVTLLSPPFEGAFYPPTDFDLLSQHLGLAQAFLANGSLVETPWTRIVFIPLLVHSVFTGGMSWTHFLTQRIDIFPTLLSTTALIFMMCGVCEFFKRRKLDGIYACILMLLFPVVRWHLRAAYMDGYLTLVIVSCFLAAESFLSTKENKYFLMVAFFSGIAFSVKHFGAPYSIPIILWCGLVYIQRKNRLKIPILLLSIVCGALPVIYFFWFNYLQNGALLFPFMKSMGSRYWEATDQEGFASSIHFFSEGRTPVDWFILPYLTAVTDKFNNAGEYIVSALWLPVWFLIHGYFVMCLASKRKVEAIKWFLLFIINAQTLYWFYSMPCDRYFMVVLVLSSVLGALIILEMRLDWFVRWAMILLLFSWQNLNIIHVDQLLAPPVSVQEVSSYLETHSELYSISRYLGGIEKNNTHTYVYDLHAEAGLYNSLPHIGDWFGVNRYDRFAPSKFSSLKEFLSTRKITHILYNESAAAYIKNFPESMGKYSVCFKQIYETDILAKVKLFEVDQNNPFCFDSSMPTHFTTELASKYFPRVKNYTFENVR